VGEDWGWSVVATDKKKNALSFQSFGLPTFSTLPPCNSNDIINLFFNQTKNNTKLRHGFAVFLLNQRDLKPGGKFQPGSFTHIKSILKMKKVLLSILAFTAVNCSVIAQTTSLFDGKTTNGWHSYNKTGPGAWSVVDGTLQLEKSERSGRPGNR